MPRGSGWASGAAAGFGPQAHPPKQDPSAANTIQDKTKGNSNFHGDNMAPESHRLLIVLKAICLQLN